MKQILEKVSFWTLAVLIPACLLAKICWATALFVDNPVDYQPSVQVNVPKMQKTVKLYTPEEAKERIKVIAEARNFKKLDLLLKVVECESHFNQFAYNANKGGSVDRGICQWNDYFHSKMTNEQAFDVDYSINKMMDYFDQNKEHLWACTKSVS